MTQAEFARHRGVSKAVVTKWKAQGLLTLTDDGRVNVEATEWNLDQRPARYRGGVAHRPIRAVPMSERPAPTAAPKAPPADRPRPAGPDQKDEGEAGDPDDPNLPLPLAIRRKENFLGLQRKRAVEKEDGKLVDRAAAEKLFFDTARDLRDAWLAWFARVAITMADELKVDPRALTQILTAHVHQHLAELGEPTADLGRHRQPLTEVASGAERSP
ncbi:hypothetical protein [Methylobacterium nodulans]|uniref:Uncharacterized protein n=1 Tax=Methylobacterium nodulans (strain LMG 21967 / CNCM I-2342 / ORS 2060) TaxID=460265 RepID=B8IEU0_METNO|nr:hypothetical protein [Methylobacterium nodulans]ACL61433.1 hypothetical protein Mnod_6671 [Methylobacterium nodulans ORS 2060]